MVKRILHLIEENVRKEISAVATMKQINFAKIFAAELSILYVSVLKINILFVTLILSIRVTKAKDEKETTIVAQSDEEAVHYIYNVYTRSPFRIPVPTYTNSLKAFHRLISKDLIGLN